MLAVALGLCVLVPRAAASTAPASPARGGGDIVVSAVIERPPATSVAVARPAQTVTVLPGQTVSLLAGKYHSDTSAIRWANRMTSDQLLTPGQTLLIPPGPGALVRVLPNETPSAFATRVHIDPSIILDYNSLTSNSPLAAGVFLQVPLPAAPVGSLIGARFVLSEPGVPAVAASHAADTYPYGQCTWYVASRRAVSWSGNAINWWWNAAHIRPEGHVPVQGSIAVFRGGWDGHVAYVEHVNADGSFQVSEMNYWANGGGWGRVDHRTLSPNDWALVGFIY
ncbi:MAG TPA: CHAP domain-containing protein [Candidatus Dormibacteraeota bacterium]|nr:CHAP domain-containing protein [Candidatus Dormibacteraeota bacterium]